MGASSNSVYGALNTKPTMNTRELVLEWIMTYGESPVHLDAFRNKNPKFLYIDDKYLDKSEDTEEYALNSFAKALLVE